MHTYGSKDIVKDMSKKDSSRSSLSLLLTVFTVIIVITAICFVAFWLLLKQENHLRYAAIKNVAAEKISKTAWGMEMNAENVFDEVGKHLDSPEAVIEALESKANLNPEVRGYFAAFVPDYFPQKGTWFEPYIHQADSGQSGKYVLSLVGSARHDYTKSDWYVRALKTHDSFWSDPYYYFDGTSISGHYCTYVKPIFDGSRLACVCGADMTFEWLTKSLEQIDASAKSDEQLEHFLPLGELDFYTVVFNHDGSCIAHPENKRLMVTDEHIIKEIGQNKSGMFEIDVKGEPCTVYYGSIEHVNWSVLVVVPQHGVWKSLQLVGITMLLLALAGMLIVWLSYRRLCRRRIIV